MSTLTTMQRLGYGIQSAMARLGVPGVAVGILQGDTQQTAGYGVTSVDHPLPVTAETLFQIGSITKTFLATLIMRLVEADKLDLDRPIRHYLPELRLTDEATAAGVTLNHLLTHSAGWEGDFFDDTGFGDDALARYVVRMTELPQITPLGAIFNYNNAGFSLAGRVIEVVTGQTFESAMAEWLLQPLGLQQALFRAEEVISERFAVGHHVQDELPTIARPWALARSAHPAGGLTTSVRDLLRYARFHLGDGLAADGTRLLQSATLADMRTPRLTTSVVSGNTVGLAWMLSTIDGVQLAQHGGATNGQMANLLLVPAHGLAVAVVTNGNRGSLLNGEVNRWVLRHLLGLVQPEPTPQVRPADQLATYTGRYRQRLTEIDLALSGGELIMTVIPKGGFPKSDSPPRPAPPPARLGFIGDDAAIVLDTYQQGTRLEFLRDRTGRLEWLRTGVRLFARQ